MKFTWRLLILIVACAGLAWLFNPATAELVIAGRRREPVSSLALLGPPLVAVVAALAMEYGIQKVLNSVRHK
jgi:hypothetical protein